ncbi:MAG: 2,3-bisphosphoglycerate-dependent phosphoglycerate mutase [Nitrospirales bacterium]|nr:MAG: 2,3-bisphosphoglycerate-dependent phosphoglycerate mutase [Nitrospirales bacterium]
MIMAQLILIRHGESQWNLENKFTGWVDVELTPKGIQEAKDAGENLRPYCFDQAFTSGLKRAQETLRLILEVTGQTDLAIERDPALNERMYGDLQGLNKAETVEKFGEAQVKIWRRSYDIPPPGGESLKDTAERVLPYYERRIYPEVLAGKTILVAAHGNSLRALVMHLEQLSKEEILEVNIPTGAPLLYDIDEQGTVVNHRYL